MDRSPQSRLHCRAEAESTLGSKGADTRGQGGACRLTLLSVQSDLLCFQGALRIAIKAPGLIVEYPIWILAFISALAPLFSFRSNSAACLLAGRLFLSSYHYYFMVIVNIFFF